MTTRRVWAAVYVATLVVAWLMVAGTIGAMPEYATQLGEPCATCHISPAGGGLRTARGQAWVAREKPGVVPTLEEAMQILGVKTTINPADYAPAPLPRPKPTMLNRDESPKKNWQAWLSDHAGN